MKGFNGDIDVADNLKAELLALLVGLQLAWRCHYKDVLCILDSLHAVQLVHDQHDHCHKYVAIIVGIKKCLAKPWKIEIRHSIR